MTNKKRNQAIKDKIEGLKDDLADLNTGRSVSVDMTNSDVRKEKTAIRAQIEKLQDQLKAIK